MYIHLDELSITYYELKSLARLFLMEIIDKQFKRSSAIVQ